MTYRGRVTQQLRKIRRSPNVVAFLATGGVVGLVAGCLLSVLGSSDPIYGPLATLGFLGVGGAALGVLVGGLVAVLLDSRR